MTNTPGTAGHLVVEAVSAESALASVAQAVPDVVLTDLRLPGQSGEQLIARLREAHRDVRVIAISGAPERLAALDAEGAGVLLLPKPFTTEQLNSAIEGAIRPAPRSFISRLLRFWTGDA